MGADTCMVSLVLEVGASKMTSRSYKKGSSKDHRWAWGTCRVKPCPTTPVLDPTGCPAELAFTTTCTPTTHHFGSVFLRLKHKACQNYN